MAKFQLPLLIIIAVAVFNQHSFGAPTQGLSTDDLANILKPIAENERSEFIRENFELGYRIQELKQAWPHTVEADLAVQIFNYVVRNQDVINKRKINDDLANYKEQICLPEPIGCFDPGDAPIRPN